MQTEEEDLDTGNSWYLCRHQQTVHSLGNLQSCQRYRDVEYANLPSLESANVDQEEDWHFGDLLRWWTVSIWFPHAWNREEGPDAGTDDGSACIAGVMRLVYVVFLTRTKDYTYVHFEATMWA